ncbi:MAG: hypothetical protein KC478_09310 [Bacteriovoracaceae bacterium]|nr:hypothetical protein [Bacteriovoracaceae bacterium]
MKVKNVIGMGLAVFAFTACNEKVEQKLKTVYEQEQRNKETFTATDKYGPLKVRVGEFVGESKIKPWSSWWYPLSEKTLFYKPRGGASPLEKYDYYAGKKFNSVFEAALVEERDLYRANEVGWAGLCHAWAIASVLHPEPNKTKTVNGVKFTVGDQKALLLKTYEKATGISDIMIGHRFNGDRKDDYDDIYPDQFHKLVQNHLVENQTPFLMDYDPRFPVWTVPVYKVKFQISKIDESSAKVAAWVTFASPHVDDMSFVGTKRVMKGYHYILKGSWSNGSLNVTDGEWIEESKHDHPDYLISFPNTIERGSFNDQIKPEIVDTILK